MERWPELVHEQWAQTQATLHLWTQIVGKIRLKLEPFVNHWWNVTLYVTPTGLATGAMPYPGGRTLQIDFDLLHDALHIAGCDGERGGFALEAMSVAAFYERLMGELERLGFPVKIHGKPNEVAEAIPFAQDTVHAAYDKEYAERFWRVLLQTDRVFKTFRSPFRGKASPVHFFWGSFDLALSLFSGRPAPPHPGGFPNMPDSATREAYSAQEYSCGFWPGAPGIDALFYAYAYPQPEGYEHAAIAPEGAGWNAALREFVLPYATVRAARDPEGVLREFLESSFSAAARLAGWADHR